MYLPGFDLQTRKWGDSFPPDVGKAKKPAEETEPIGQQLGPQWAGPVGAGPRGNTTSAQAKETASSFLLPLSRLGLPLAKRLRDLGKWAMGISRGHGVGNGSEDK